MHGVMRKKNLGFVYFIQFQFQVIQIYHKQHQAYNKEKSYCRIEKLGVIAITKEIFQKTEKLALAWPRTVPCSKTQRSFFSV